MANMVKLVNSRHGKQAVDGRNTRFVVMLTRSEAKAIQDFRFGNRLATKATAARLLMRMGLQALKSGKELPEQLQDTAFVIPPE
jgi:hypothetical protein